MMTKNGGTISADRPGGRLTLLLAGLALVATLAAAVGWSLAPGPIEQPIAFNHRLHVEELGSSCTDCHLYAETGVRATIPNIELCSDCHAEAMTESAEEARLVEHIEGEQPLPWRKLYLMPDHVYFSHRRHTAVAGIECRTCHGEMAGRETPMPRPEVRLTMDFCMDCHDETGTSNDCLLCHR